ncbi:MAG TPA: cytochrome b5 domain-containing protein [Candidatus Saccharimonadales bacterium]|nr:cytochrome b5 domain-containing protein [Candidatus Saccharimonadales bacterium]
MKLKIAVAASLGIVAIIVTAVIVAGLLSGERNRTNQQPGEDTASAALTAQEVANHSSQNDCWIIVGGDVYDVTDFIADHPGGAARITSQCGKDATTAFQTQGGEGSHSAAARNQLESFRVGSLSGEATGEQPQNQPTDPGTSSNGSLPAAISEKYPGASVQQQEQDNDGEQEIELTYQGQCREIRLDASGSITRDREC